MWFFTFLPIIVLIIEVLLVGYYFYYAYKNKKLVSKETIIYFVPISLILFVLYVLGANYDVRVNHTSLSVIDYLAILKTVITSAVFDLKIEYVNLLIEDNVIFKISYITAVVLSIVCVYASILNLIYHAFSNKIRLALTLRRNCDILIGDNEYNKEYIKNNNQCIILTNNAKVDNLEEYYVNKIPVIQNKFDSQTLMRFIRRNIKKKRELNFISFNDSSTNLGLIKEFEQFLNMEINSKKVIDYKVCYLKVEIDASNQMSIKNKILENKSLAAFIDCFTRYELFALNFIEKNPITEHLPEGFIDINKGIINKDKTINVVYLGFGKISKTLHRVQLMNDQIPTINDNNEVEIFKINYIAYDKDSEASEDKNMTFFFKRYDENITKYSTKDYFPPCDKLDNLVLEPVNIESYHIVNKIVELLNKTNKQDTYNRFIISYGDDIDNIDMAIKVSTLLKEYDYKNYEIYVRVKGEFPAAIKLLDDKRINVIGDIASIFNHDVIVNERLLELAKLVNKKYNTKRLSDSSWYNLTAIKQASNVYSSLNIRLKLNLLGFDYVRENSIVDNQEVIKEIEDKVKFDRNSYDDYLFYKINKNELVHILAYQEHIRWNAFYIGNGYVPLKKDQIKLIEVDGEYGPVFYKDDNVLNLHGCLTTYKGLDDYHRHLAKLLSKANKKSIEENIDMVETYKYDHMIIESIKPMFKDSNYRLIKK